MARESGRPCGCDPAADHPCTGHAAYRDPTDHEIEAQFVSAELGARPTLTPGLVVVSGPDQDGEIVMLASSEVYLSRFQAEDLAHEILRRLQPRSNAT